MGTTGLSHSVRSTGPLSWTAILLSQLAIVSLDAAPITLVDSTKSSPASPRHTYFAQRVDRAAEKIRQQVRIAPACKAYFEELGVDLDAWLDPEKPPYVIPRRLQNVSHRGDTPVCGAAQGRHPFELLFVDTYCFQRPRVCDLASLLLHEMGHLARRDTEDNEPKEFFDACRLSSCIDPARFD